jgi:hypothetical protein
MLIRKQIRRSNREEIVSGDHSNAPLEYERFVGSMAWQDVIAKAMTSLSPSGLKLMVGYSRFLKSRMGSWFLFYCPKDAIQHYYLCIVNVH